MIGGRQTADQIALVTAHFVAACREHGRRGLPSATSQAAKRVVLDTLGAMLAASDPIWPGTRRVSAFVAGEQRDGICTIVGSHLRAAPSLAAFANGYLAYALDIESHHGPAVLHAAAAVLPSALAIAERCKSAGDRFLTATSLGVEVACRVSLAIGPNDLYARGFHPTSVAGAFGAAAAGAVLLDLDSDRFANALGLAAMQAAGLLAWAGDQSEESRPFNPGIAARNGVTAAHLSDLGFGAPPAIFDPQAKFNAFRAWSLDGVGGPEHLTTVFEEPFAVEELTIKRYACCAFLHPAIDALLDIMAATNADVSNLTELVMRFPRSGAEIIDGNPLRSHRAQYILPVAAVRRAIRFDDVLNDRSTEPEICRLAEATRVVPDDDLDRHYPGRYTTILEVFTSNGTTHRRRVEWAKGTPQNPMTEEEIVAKFLNLAAPRVGMSCSEEIVSLVMELDRGDRFNELLSCLAVA